MNVWEMAVVVRMKADLRSAMKARQSIAVSTIRSMLSAIDNAGAVEQDASHTPVYGRSSEVPRRALSEAQVMALLAAEAEGRRSAMIHYEQLGKHSEAQQLRQELEVIGQYLSLDS